MKFLPYEQFTFHTRLTPDQIRQKLSDQMEEAKALLSWIPVTMNKPMVAQQNNINSRRVQVVL